jgi:uncharacterized protein (TIGR02145 family)
MISKRKFQIASIAAILIMFVCVSCEDDKITPEPIIETGVLVDVENHTYGTVKIGDAWWMSENLKVTKYRNGTSINQFQDASDWSTGLPAYCLFDNNQTSPGLLYNKAAVSSSNGLAPEGWHVATEQDWQNLERELGMSNENIDSFDILERSFNKKKIECKFN